MPDYSLTQQERSILRVLQNDGRIANAELAQRVGMSSSPCWRKVRMLEEEGVITGYATRLDRRAIGLGVQAMVHVQIDDHSEDATNAFESGVQALEEVVSCHQVTGGADYMLTIVTRDLDSYADFANRRLRRLKGIKSISTTFVLKEVKANQGLPL